MLAPMEGSAEPQTPSTEQLVESTEQQTTGKSKEPSAPRLSRLLRWSLFSLSVFDAVLLATAAGVLPWRFSLAVHTLCAALVLGLLTTAVLAALQHAWLVRVGRMTAWLCLGSFAALVGQICLWSQHIVSLYGEMGWAITGGLVVFVCALGLFLVPLPLFMLLLLPRQRAGGRVQRSVTSNVAPSATESSALVLLAFILFSPSPAKADSAASDAQQAQRAVQEALQRSPETRNNASLYSDAPISCADPKRLDGAWVLTMHAKKRVKTVCLQGSTDEKRAAVPRALRGNTGRSVKLDVLHTKGERPATNSLLNALSLRPGLDGLCAAEACLLPWQLNIKQSYVAYVPLPAVPEARFGVDLEALAEELHSHHHAPLTIFTTDSSVIALNAPQSDQPPTTSVVPLYRMGPGAVPVTKDSLARSRQLATRYIIRAQNKKGVFRYILRPYTGGGDARSISLPRHAGTTLVLCEQGESEPELKDTVRRATKLIAEHYFERDGVGYFQRGPGHPSLGATALPVIALLECSRAGLVPLEQHWPQLTEFLLHQQRDDGSFYPELNVATLKPQGEGEALFAAGQAVYALLLVEEHLLQNAAEQTQLRARVTAAIDRAMAYYSGPYWSHAPEDFFYIEENWHCLAARAALRHHRNDDYERFCLDYVTFKARFIQDSTTLGFQGGVTLSPLFAPHATATSGFGEATAAALEIAAKRKEKRPYLEAKLRKALGYLLQIQLQPQSCFACSSRSAYGGFTESPVSGDVRIDFVQHALAALSHGGEMLELIDAPAKQAAPSPRN